MSKKGVSKGLHRRLLLRRTEPITLIPLNIDFQYLWLDKRKNMWALHIYDENDNRWTTAYVSQFYICTEAYTMADGKEYGLPVNHVLAIERMVKPRKRSITPFLAPSCEHELVSKPSESGSKWCLQCHTLLPPPEV